MASKIIDLVGRPFGRLIVVSFAGKKLNDTARNVRIDFDGRSMTVSQWAKELGLSASTIHSRLRRKLPPGETLATK